MNDTVKSDTVYDHEEHGEVLVTKIGVMTDSWALGRSEYDEQKLEESEVLVFFHSSFDGYGGMRQPLTEEVSNFIRKSEAVRPFTESESSPLRSDLGE